MVRTHNNFDCFLQLHLLLYFTLHFVIITIICIIHVNGESSIDLLSLSSQQETKVCVEDSPSAIITGDYILEFNKCGQELTSHKGKFVYKLQPQHGVSDRCVWIIRVPNATSYTLQVNTTGESDDGVGDGVIINSLGFGQQTFINSNEMNPPYHLQTSAVLVTFYSSSKLNANYGFELEYHTDSSENAELDFRNDDIPPMDFIISSENGLLVYPCQEIPERGKDQFAAFVFSPGFFHQDESEKFLTLNILGGEGEEETSFIGKKGHCFNESAEIYYFSELGSRKSRWNHMERISSCSEQEIRLRNADMIMLIIQTESLSTQKRLQIAFNRS